MDDAEVEGFHATTESAVIRLEGAFGLDGIEVFHQALANALRVHAPHLVIDLTGVTSLASAGRTALLRATRLHPDLRLRGARDGVHEVLVGNGQDPPFTFDDP